MSIRRIVSIAAPVSLTLVTMACGDPEQIIIEVEPETRPIGEGCILDDECQTGRCIGGVCSDSLCEDSGDCREDELCVFDECVPADQFACTGDQAPLLSLSPLDIEFGEVALGNTGEATVTIENLGDCLLTVQGVTLESNADPGFGCSPCDVASFPQRIAPQRSLDVTVTYSPPAAGEAYSKMYVRTDDTTAGDEGLVEVDLHATYSGVPVIIIDPLELYFGNVSQGAQATETITIRNQGSGNAAAAIKGIYVHPPVEFSIPAEFDDIRPTDPLFLAPYDPNNPDTVIEIPVTFHPSGLNNYSSTVYVEADYGDEAASETFTVDLSGSSLGPPQINVDTDQLIFRDDADEPYTVGYVAYRQVTITNSGQSELVVNMSVQDNTGDFTVSPTFVPPIAPGGAVVLSVFYNPSAPSDPANEHDPQQPINAFLNITSNDDDPATDVLKTVALEGWAKGGLFDDVLKLEMEFENADNSWAGNDYRDVDLELISDLGFSCGKPNYTYIPDGNGGYQVDPLQTEDLCEEWSDYQLLGSANWVAIGQYQEPERILLYGLGQDLADGDQFTARIHYLEDCANIPTGILADLLGIGASVLLGIIGGSVGVPITVPPDQISDFISENCWDHESSLVTLHVYVNGEEVAAPQYRLQNKGDFHDIIKLQREDGQFTLLPQ